MHQVILLFQYHLILIILKDLLPLLNLGTQFFQYQNIQEILIYQLLQSHQENLTTKFLVFQLVLLRQMHQLILLHRMHLLHQYIQLVRLHQMDLKYFPVVLSTHHLRL
mgnify:CR=1 FL=1